MIDVRHLALHPQVEPVARYVAAYESSKGRKPERVHIGRKEFDSLLRLARQKALDPMMRGSDRVSYQGIPVVGI